MSVLDELFGDIPTTTNQNNNNSNNKKIPTNHKNATPSMAPISSNNEAYDDGENEKDDNNYYYSPQQNQTSAPQQDQDIKERFLIVSSSTKKSTTKTGKNDYNNIQQEENVNNVTNKKILMKKSQQQLRQQKEKQKRLENRSRILSKLSSHAFPSSTSSSSQMMMNKSSRTKQNNNNNNQNLRRKFLPIPPPSQVWQWISQQGRFAEALNVLDTLATLRCAEWEEREMNRCRFFEGDNNNDDDDDEDEVDDDDDDLENNNKNNTGDVDENNNNNNIKKIKRRSHDDLLEESIEHRDKMRLLRAEALVLHAATTFASDFPNVALQPFLSEHHCEKARKQIVSTLKAKLSASDSSKIGNDSTTANSSSSSSSSRNISDNESTFFLEKLQSWGMLMEEDRVVLRQELSFAVEALESLCVTQAHSVQELILISAVIQLNRAVYYLCASVLPGVVSSIPKSGQERNKKEVVEMDKKEINEGDNDEIIDEASSSSTSSCDDENENESDEEDEESTKTLDHTLLAASLLLKRPSWQSLATFNRKSLVDKSLKSENILKIASSVQRCMKLCQKFKMGGKLCDARVLISTSVMLAELQSALDVALPEALKQQQQQQNNNSNNFENNSKFVSESSTHCNGFRLLSSEEYSQALFERNSNSNNVSGVASSFLKCDISGSLIKMSQGDAAVRIFVPTSTSKTTPIANSEKENETFKNISTVYRFDRAKKEKSPSAKRDIEMIVDRDVWMFFQRHCVQK